MHRPITTCSLTTTPEHLPAQAAFSRSAISLKTFELGIPSSFAIASGAALSPERRHTIAVLAPVTSLGIREVTVFRAEIQIKPQPLSVGRRSSRLTSASSIFGSNATWYITGNLQHE